MFYSESLLAKTGPLARVWLAANLERKLTKQNVLQSNLDNNVKDIMGSGQAPLALRLSGQLLLGVVRIYSKKAKYLLEDCSEALGKIKLAFRPGNVDLPANQTHTAHPNALILPDTITELDLFAPLPDPDDLLREPPSGVPGRDRSLMDFSNSQLLPDSQTPSKRPGRPALQLEDDDLGLDLGLELDEPETLSMPMDDEPSVEIGRRAATPRADRSSLLEEDDLGLDIGFGESTVGHDTTLRPFDEDLPMPGFEGDDHPMDGGAQNFAASNAAALARAEIDVAERRDHRSASPLSSLRSSVERDLERTFQLDHTALEEVDDTAVQAAQRVKRRKVLPQDAQTEMHNSQIKKQQEDRSGILRVPSLLPRDPLLLQLMEMQRNGAFVSNILGDGRMAGWAPELHGILSVEVVRKAGERKRKRDAGVADLGSETLVSSPRLELPQDQDDDFPLAPDVDDMGANPATLHEDTGLLIGSDEAGLDAFENEVRSSPGPAFDVTEAPLLHPSQFGPVPLGTKTAVAALRQHFAPGHVGTEPPTPSRRTRAEAKFSELCPANTTSRNEATKTFFELLILGTKDAVKVEQEHGKGLDGEIRVRGKRGLWGVWAEVGEGQHGTQLESQSGQDLDGEVAP